jgi:dCTP diphosphatase
LHFALLTFLQAPAHRGRHVRRQRLLGLRVPRHPAAIRDTLPLPHEETPMESPLPVLANRLREFVAERDWDKFHSPKNLAMALVGEAGELAAEFQWMTEEQSKAPDAAQMDRIRAEAADVLIYLVRLADKLNIDLIAAAHDKMDANAHRYPADKVRGSSKKYSEYG